MWRSCASAIIDVSSPFHFTAEDVSYFILQQKLIVFLQ